MPSSGCLSRAWDRGTKGELYGSWLDAELECGYSSGLKGGRESLKWVIVDGSVFS